MKSQYGAMIFGGLIFVAGLACIPRSQIRGPSPPEPNIHPSAPFLLPLKNPTILSRYGERGHKFHTGIDLREKKGGGDPVLASRAGRVTFCDRLSGYGKLVSILHDDGYTTRYAHLHTVYVKKGEHVDSLEKIGTVGKTGRATTAHLHFEILTPKFHFLDPYPYLFPPKKITPHTSTIK